MPIDTRPGAARRRLVTTGLAGLPLALLGGCAAFNYVAADAPDALATIAPLVPPPRLALVLGGGGPRGYAHIGVLRVLEQAGITPDLVVGTSVGALLGVFWASGRSADDIDAMARQRDPMSLFDLSLLADRGWAHGQRLQDYVNDELQGRRLQDLPRRVIVVTTRRDDKAPRFFSTGNAGVAVRASSALPGILSPVGIRGVEYEDGDESLPLAVSAARAAGARFAIAVDVSAWASSTPPDAPATWVARDAVRRARIDPEAARADFLVHPDLGYWARPRREYFDRFGRIGEDTMRRLLPALRQQLQDQAAGSGS